MRLNGNGCQQVLQSWSCETTTPARQIKFVTIRWAHIKAPIQNEFVCNRLDVVNKGTEKASLTQSEVDKSLGPSIYDVRKILGFFEPPLRTSTTIEGYSEFGQ